MDFSGLFIQLKGEPADTLAEAQAAGATIAYGKFLMVVINFIIVAWVLFIVVKAMNRMKAKPAPAAPAAPPAPPREEVLLTEIRDLLKTRKV